MYFDVLKSTDDSVDLMFYKQLFVLIHALWRYTKYYTIKYILIYTKNEMYSKVEFDFFDWCEISSNKIKLRYWEEFNDHILREKFETVIPRVEC